MNTGSFHVATFKITPIGSIKRLPEGAIFTLKRRDFAEVSQRTTPGYYFQAMPTKQKR
ncbi:MAG: hypothetical protein KKG00_02115 [Bacteroidetes bacterium]|nr:hypothetical protein [Bacteroidota bacterium]